MIEGRLIKPVDAIISMIIDIETGVNKYGNSHPSFGNIFQILAHNLNNQSLEQELDLKLRKISHSEQDYEEFISFGVFMKLIMDAFSQ